MENQAVTKDADAPEQSKSKNLFFFLQSVVLAVLFPIVLVRSRGNALIAVWRLSLLLCSYFYSVVCVLSAATRRSKARLFVLLAYAALLALVIDAVLSHAAGTVIIWLSSVWIAGVFGHALAEHRASEIPAPVKEAREEIVRELVSIIGLALAYSACAIPICFLLAGCSLEFFLIMIVVVCSFPLVVTMVLGDHRASFPKAAAPSSKEVQGKLAGELGSIVFLALVLSAYGLIPLCIVSVADVALFQTSPLEFVLVFLPMVMGLYVPVATICTLKPLRPGGGGFDLVVVLGVECDTVKVLLFSYISSFVLFTLSFLLASKVKAVVAVLWICILGFAVLLGYCLPLYGRDGIHRWSLVRMVAPPELLKKKQAGLAEE